MQARVAVDGMPSSDELGLRLASERAERAQQFGERVTRLREARGLTKKALAQRCQIPESVLSAVEKGRREARITMILILAEGLELTPGELLRPLKAPSRWSHRGDNDVPSR